jgi:hypothetical protein
MTGGSDPLHARACPACGKPLRVAPARDPRAHDAWAPPSLRLELGVPISEDIRPWRLSTFPDAQGRVIERVSRSYTPRSRDQVFDLCGDGHIFLTERSPGARNECTRWTVVAAVGGSATGKSYLLARTLAQRLRATGAAIGLLPGYDTAMRYEASIADVLEDLPGKALRDGYRETYENNAQMRPTTLNDMFPSVLLAREVSRRLEFAAGEGNLVTKIKDIHAELAGGPDSWDLPDPARWGQGMRQPIVLRTRFGHHGSWTHAWTGIADLAGESFHWNKFADEEQRRLLQSFDGVVWVVDPAINERVAMLVDKALRRSGRTDGLARSVIPASNRAFVGTDLGPDLRRRESTQEALADRLARMEDGFRREGGGPRRQLHVVLGKADLIHAALAVGGFEQFGEEQTDVLDGTVTYLEYVLRRTATTQRPGTVPIFPSTELARVLERLRSADPATRRERVVSFATTLLGHYSDPDRFWQLVDGGAGATLKLPAVAHRGAGSLTVPSIDAHLVDSLQEDSAALMHPRDLVMSAVGCGLIHGLGYDEATTQMLDDGEQEVRVFICSPLGTLPAQEGSDLLATFRPAEKGKSWPRHAKPSAGMTQLLLAVLRRARP